MKITELTEDNIIQFPNKSNKKSADKKATPARKPLEIVRHIEKPFIERIKVGQELIYGGQAARVYSISDEHIVLELWDNVNKKYDKDSELVLLKKDINTNRNLMPMPHYMKHIEENKHNKIQFYTVGETKTYDRYYNEFKKRGEDFLKLGKNADADGGGIVFLTKKSANDFIHSMKDRYHVDPNKFSIYGLNTDKNNVYFDDKEDMYRLKTSCPIVKLTNQINEITQPKKKLSDEQEIVTALTGAKNGAQIEKNLKSLGWGIGAEGGFGKVFFKSNKNYVIKITAEEDFGYEAFVNLVHQYPNKHFPKITKDIVVNGFYVYFIEKLKPCNNIKLISEIVEYFYLLLLTNDKNRENNLTLIKKFEQKYPSLAKAVKIIYNEVEEDSTIQFDEKAHNIMQRNDGTIVFIDPFVSEYSGTFDADDLQENGEISNVNESFPGSNKNKIYKLLIDTIGCGPFDGGCVIFARALQIKFGGDIIVLCDKNIAQHAAVYLGKGNLIDADGKLPAENFIDRFEELEGVTITNIRPLHNNDLPDAPRDEKLSQEIASLLT